MLTCKSTVAEVPVALLNNTSSLKELPPKAVLLTQFAKVCLAVTPSRPICPPVPPANNIL